MLTYALGLAGQRHDTLYNLAIQHAATHSPPLPGHVVANLVWACGTQGYSTRSLEGPLLRAFTNVLAERGPAISMLRTVGALVSN